MISSRNGGPWSARRRRWRLVAATIVLGLAGGLALAGCGGSSDGDDAGSGGAKGAAGEKVKVFFTAGEQFAPVEHEVTDPDVAPRQATEALLRGPSKVDPQVTASRDLKTLIPDGVQLEDLRIDDAGEARLDLSREFLGDIPAAAGDRTRAEDEAVNARLSQVAYTLTAFKKVDSVKVRSGGLTVEASGRGTGGISPDIEQERSDFHEPPAVPKVPRVRVRGESGALTSGTRSLQERLVRLKYLPRSAVDGINGYQTQQAVLAFQSWEGLDRDGVAGPATRAALRTATTPRPKAKRPKRLMEVHLAKGVLLLVKDGRTQRAIHVSAGAPATATPTGRYRVFRKELMSWSVPFSSWLPYASYFNNGIAFHEYPEVPPYPASHGCVRVPTPDAKRVYEFARMNRVVVVRS